MKTNFKNLSLVGTLFAGSLASAADIKIGVVNFQQALAQVKKAQTVKAKFQKDVDQRKAELQKEEKDLQAMQEEMQKKAAVLSDDAKQKKFQEFQKKLAAYQGKVQTSTGEFQKKELELVQPIVVELRSLVPEIARKSNVDMVLENSNESVLYAVTRIDMTEQLIKAYDEKFK